ncbi:MAG: hypothetical protein JXR95_16470 [Deltaproteobacteria bacterium]|nr:hypothetical protein [Deltaproteobacteria bacterium]
MNKKLIIITAFLLMGLSESVQAGGMIHNSNLSPEYARTLTRNAALDAIDIANYNPAGLVFMNEGNYISLGNQFIAKKYSHSTDTATFGDERSVLIFPSLFAVKNMGKFAVFGSFTVPAGGGYLEYKDGVAIAPGVNAEGFTAHYAITAGGAYKVSDMISVAIGLRGMYAHKTTKLGPIGDGSYLLDYESNAQGFTGIISVNVHPMDWLNIALRYEIQTVLEFENEGNYGTDADTYREDLPAVLGFGVSASLLRKITLELNVNYYFNKNADWEGLEKDVDNGFETAMSASYKISDMFTVSAGILYTNAGADKNTYDFLKPPLDAFTMGAGLKITPIKELSINAAVLKSIYFEDDGYAGALEVTLNKDITLFTIGAQYKF